MSVNTDNLIELARTVADPQGDRHSPELRVAEILTEIEQRRVREAELVRQRAALKAECNVESEAVAELYRELLNYLPRKPGPTIGFGS